MLRFVVTEAAAPLPPIDRAPPVVIGSGAHAHVRLPASTAHDRHVRIERDRWQALADVVVDGTLRRAGETGAFGAALAIQLGGYRVDVTRAPAGAIPTPPQRTESLARELMRGLLGAAAAPTIAVERGPNVGEKRTLPPPESTLVIGRGDDADWSIVDEDISRRHVEVRRTWDGITIADLDSENGTRVDGARLAHAIPLVDGARIEIGGVVLAFSDPAGRSTAKPRAIAVTRASAPAGSIVPFVVAITVMTAALVGLVYVLAAT